MIVPQFDDLHIYVDQTDSTKRAVVIYPVPTEPEMTITIGERVFYRDVALTVAQRRHMIEAVGGTLKIKD